MTVLGDRLVAVHVALDGGRVAHAFGGAIALAYCTEEPRGTRDIDVNVFVDSHEAPRVLSLLPPGVDVTPSKIEQARRDGQVRLWWDDTPIDVFFDVHDFHRQAAGRVRTVPFLGTEIPVLGCAELAVFKVLFDRTRDWADLEAMRDADALDATEVLGWVARLLGTDDARTRRLADFVQDSGPGR